MRIIIHKKGFTLVEIIVSMAILSIIMVSVISIYISSSDVALKTDINRMMQENIKNAVAHITEDVRKNGIAGFSNEATVYTNIMDITPLYGLGNALEVGDSEKRVGDINNGNNRYYLSDGNNRVDNSFCSEFKNHCILVKNSDDQPLTNSSVSIKDLQFYVSNENIPKVTMVIVMQPAIGRGVKPYLIKENKLIFQTTISERPF